MAERHCNERYLGRVKFVRCLSVPWQLITTGDVKSKFEARALGTCQTSHNDLKSALSFEVAISGDILSSAISPVNVATLRNITHTNPPQTSIHSLLTKNIHWYTLSIGC